MYELLYWEFRLNSRWKNEDEGFSFGRYLLEYVLDVQFFRYLIAFHVQFVVHWIVFQNFVLIQWFPSEKTHLDWKEREGINTCNSSKRVVSVSLSSSSDLIRFSNSIQRDWYCFNVRSLI